MAAMPANQTSIAKRPHRWIYGGRSSSTESGRQYIACCEVAGYRLCKDPSGEIRYVAYSSQVEIRDWGIGKHYGRVIDGAILGAWESIKCGANPIWHRDGFSL